MSLAEHDEEIPRWWETDTLRKLARVEGAGWRLLGQESGPVPVQYSFAAWGTAELAEITSVVALGDAGRVLAVIQYGGGVSDNRGVDSIDFAGLRWRDWVVLFHAEKQSAQGAVSFDVTGGDKLHFVTTGLAPGAWQLWRDGWLESERRVEARAGMLYWQGKAGGYFLRRWT